jgi:hypothetical protein
LSPFVQQLLVLLGEPVDDAVLSDKTAMLVDAINKLYLKLGHDHFLLHLLAGSNRHITLLLQG